MNENILAVWSASPGSDTSSIVIPDGCRDLILFQPEGDEPQWFISPLFDKAKSVSISAGTIMLGFRMKPGVSVNDGKLLASIEDMDVEEIQARLNNFSYRKDSVGEALDCLAVGDGSINRVAKQLGVSQRTLQRLLIRETGKTPLYWMMLARVRKTARAIFEPISDIEIADMYGYADQSHMCREVKRWFNVTPSVLRRSQEAFHRINDVGYD